MIISIIPLDCCPHDLLANSFFVSSFSFLLVRAKFRLILRKQKSSTCISKRWKSHFRGPNFQHFPGHHIPGPLVYSNPPSLNPRSAPALEYREQLQKFTLTLRDRSLFNRGGGGGGKATKLKKNFAQKLWPSPR